MAGATVTDYRETIRDLQFEAAHQTAWGVDILDADAFRDITAADPTGYYHQGHGLHWDIIEWYDPRHGGAALVRRNSHDPDEVLAALPEALSSFEAAGRPSRIGESPRSNGDLNFSLAKHVGLQVLAHSELVTAVQLPGIDDYGTAYRFVNGREPDVTVDPNRAGSIVGSEFLDMVHGEGLWPFDMHFFDIHAPTFVVGGTAFAAALRRMAGSLSAGAPRWQIDRLGLRVDAYAAVYRQVNTADTRVDTFVASGDIAALYDDGEQDPAYPNDRTVMSRFNNIVATHRGIILPPSEVAGVSVPI